MYRILNYVIIGHLDKHGHFKKHVYWFAKRVYMLSIEQFLIECHKIKTKPVTHKLGFSANLRP